jgi:hypothetical protein
MDVRANPLRNERRGNSHRLRAIDVGVLTTLGTFDSTDRRKMMVINLDRRAFYEGTARDEWPSGAVSGSSCRVITLRSKSRWRKRRSIIEFTGTAFEKTNGGRPLGFSRRISLKMEQCGV